MPRGQALTLKCPKCGGYRFAYLGAWRRANYQHGCKTGLPASYGQWLVQCVVRQWPGGPMPCGHVWWSRHPDARIRAGYPEYGTSFDLAKLGERAERERRTSRCTPHAALGLSAEQFQAIVSRREPIVRSGDGEASLTCHTARDRRSTRRGESAGEPGPGVSGRKAER